MELIPEAISLALNKYARKEFLSFMGNPYWKQQKIESCYAFMTDNKERVFSMIMQDLLIARDLESLDFLSKMIGYHCEKHMSVQTDCNFYIVYFPGMRAISSIFNRGKTFKKKLLLTNEMDGPKKNTAIVIKGDDPKYYELLTEEEIELWEIAEDDDDEPYVAGQICSYPAAYANLDKIAKRFCLDNRFELRKLHLKAKNE